MSIQTVNPSNGNVIDTYDEYSPEKVQDIITQNHKAYLAWQDETYQTRREKMLNLANILRKKKEHLSILMANEMGKPIKWGKSELEKCALVCEYYAENAESYLSPYSIQTEMQKSYVTYQSLGSILAIMPWNFPFWQVFRFAAPNLMAGNAVLLKHAPISTGTGLEIEHLILEAGFPDNLFRTLVISEKDVSYIIENQHIKGVTLTGSGRAGKSVAEQAGRALKKVVLELGGSDPYLILNDADLEKAATACVFSRLYNTGQVCIAAKRLIAVNKIYEEFKELILQKIKNYSIGDPLDENTDLGPIARRDLREEIQRQVNMSMLQGAKVIMGGEPCPGLGFYYPITVLENVLPGCEAFDNEIFGPVISLVSAKDEDDAINLANKSQYGLGAAVFTNDINKGEIIAREKINAGCVFVNAFVGSDPRLPFGGINASGFGRELSREGIHEFVNIKTIAIT